MQLAKKQEDLARIQAENNTSFIWNMGSRSVTKSVTSTSTPQLSGLVFPTKLVTQLPTCATYLFIVQSSVFISQHSSHSRCLHLWKERIVVNRVCITTH